MSRAVVEAGLRERIDALEAAGFALRKRSSEEIAESVIQAWRSIRDPELALGRAARQQLPESTGLTLEMVAWALSTSLSEERLSELLALGRRLGPRDGTRLVPARLSAVFLAGNVFSACIEPWSTALMCRSPVAVKASTKDDALPRLFQLALHEVDPELAEASDVLVFPGGTQHLEATILSRADVVSVFGSDETLGSIRSRLDAGTTFVPHGHGFGVGYLGKDALRDDGAARAVADAVALDVAAYDQRGCMSPHVIFVQRGGRIDAISWIRTLAGALERAASRVPRGALSRSAGTAQLQWRGVAAARGELIEGEGWAVSYEGDASFRLSPGFRNILILDTSGPASFAGAVAGLGSHLKTIGVAGGDDLRAVLADALPPPLAPRICATGSMQTPSYGGLADGRPVEAGFLRFIDLVG